jgi:hypothetical protein
MVLIMCRSVVYHYQERRFKAGQSYQLSAVSIQREALWRTPI